MRHSGTTALGAVLVTASMVAVGCGSGDASGTPTSDETLHSRGSAARTYTDARGDVLVTARPEQPPGRPALDLTHVRLRRARGWLTVGFETAVPAHPPMIESLYVFGPRGVSSDALTVRPLSGGRLGAVFDPYGGPSRPVRARRLGRWIEVTAPLTKLSRQPLFKWRATVVTNETDTVDRVPSRESDYNSFPR